VIDIHFFNCDTVIVMRLLWVGYFFESFSLWGTSGYGLYDADRGRPTVSVSESQLFFEALRTSILYSSFLIYILLLISYKNHKRGVTSWIVTFSQLRLRLETATKKLEKHTAHHRNSTFIYTH